MKFYLIKGLMTFDQDTCLHSVVVGNLKANTDYKWKVTIANTWVENYGCSGRNLQTNNKIILYFYFKAI